MLLALRGSFAIIPEPARPELGEHIIGRTAREPLNRTVFLPFLHKPAAPPHDGTSLRPFGRRR